MHRWTAQRDLCRISRDTIRRKRFPTASDQARVHRCSSRQDELAQLGYAGCETVRCSFPSFPTSIVLFGLGTQLPRCLATSAIHYHDMLHCAAGASLVSSDYGLRGLSLREKACRCQVDVHRHFYFGAPRAPMGQWANAPMGQCTNAWSVHSPGVIVIVLEFLFNRSLAMRLTVDRLHDQVALTALQQTAAEETRFSDPHPPQPDRPWPADEQERVWVKYSVRRIRYVDITATLACAWSPQQSVYMYHNIEVL